MKIHPVGAELFDADRQTDRQKDRHAEGGSRISQFSNAPQNLDIILLTHGAVNYRSVPYREADCRMMTESLIMTV